MNKKLISIGVLILSLCVIVSLVALFTDAQKKKEGMTLAPGQSGTVVIGSSAEMRIVESSYYLYKPKPDITPYELALLLPLFSGPSYGMGEWSAREGAIVPVKDRMHGGWPVNGTVLSLSSYRIKELGTAMRHLEKLPN